MTHTNDALKATSNSSNKSERKKKIYTFDEIKMIKKMFLTHVNDALKATLLQYSLLIPVIRERDAKHKDSMDSQGGLEEAKDA